MSTHDWRSVEPHCLLILVAAEPVSTFSEREAKRILRRLRTLSGQCSARYAPVSAQRSRIQAVDVGNTISGGPESTAPPGEKHSTLTYPS